MRYLLLSQKATVLRQRQAPKLRARTFCNTAPQRNPTSSNYVLNSIRNEEDWTTALMVASSNSRPLITLWTASWCRTCHMVAPFVAKLVEEGAGAASASATSPSNGVVFAEVELDAPDMADVAGRYMLGSVPTLMSFVDQELVEESVVKDSRKIADEAFVKEWIAKEAARAASGGGPGLLGRLFGTS